MLCRKAISLKECRCCESAQTGAFHGYGHGMNGQRPRLPDSFEHTKDGFNLPTLAIGSKVNTLGHQPAIVSIRWLAYCMNELSVKLFGAVCLPNLLGLVEME